MYGMYCMYVVCMCLNDTVMNFFCLYGLSMDEERSGWGDGESTSIGIWVERIAPLMRRLARPYLLAGRLYSVCLSEEA